MKHSQFANEEPDPKQSLLEDRKKQGNSWVKWTFIFIALILSVTSIVLSTQIKHNRFEECYDDMHCTNGRCVRVGDSFMCVCHYGYHAENLTNCVKPPKSCEDAFAKGVMESSGNLTISPDGISLLTVSCDMNFKQGKMTEIAHSSQDEIRINGYEEVEGFTQTIHYNGDFSVILKLIDQSESCRQFMQYKCYGSVMTWDYKGTGVRTLDNVWWDRNGRKVTKFGGASKDNTCPCFDKGTCATENEGNKQHLCNCDMNDKIWREDSGYVTDKNLLPVTKISASDTGDEQERAYYTLGNIQCWG